jgi:MerR family transcriptional regulator, repressor of the yfmOP operon
MTPAAADERVLRIGEVAELTGTTPRTIRYYEEIGLLREAEDRASGKRRMYTDADVAQLHELIRMRDLLGLSLDDLKRLAQAESARAALREQWEHADDPDEQRRILDEALVHIADQRALVRDRRDELGRLDRELAARERRVKSRLRELR